jgi:serine/threonine-protein kinase
MQAALGSSYTIERELEAGGMSRVFVATEESLRRSVVIKVLPPETARWVSLERFKREILVAARLQHPHIVPLLTAGDAGGVPFYTMPFVGGESLRGRMQQSPVPLADVEAIVRDVARGLEYAHAHGVVHRDIKPENILLAGSTATVLDFGIAKALVASRTSSGSETLTQLGTALGTPAYMSPEQIAGDAVDGRGDIYSLGVIAYELLVGSHPFADKTNQQLLAAHVVEAPPPLLARRPDTPPALAALVMRCLEKDCADRPASATELLRLLEEATRPSPNVTGESPSIAVLPFTNLGGVDDEFFSDGLTADAVEYLNHAVRLGFAHYPFLARHDPHLSGIRGDPGFRRVLDRIRGAGRPGAQN